MGNCHVVIGSDAVVEGEMTTMVRFSRPDRSEAASISRSAVAASFSDQQLREECARRGWRSAIIEATDDQLRAECERRGMICELHSVSQAILMDERNEARNALKHALLREAEWKKRAEKAEASRGVLTACKDAAYRSRSEMHAELMRLIDLLTPEQAQSLLEMYKNPVVVVPNRELTVGELETLTPGNVIRVPSDPNSITIGGVRFVAGGPVELTPHPRVDLGAVAKALIERGPGISSLPPRPVSEPLAHLDVDLLCDDE